MVLKENVKVIPGKITSGTVDQMWAMKSADLCVAALLVPVETEFILFTDTGMVCMGICRPLFSFKKCYN